MFLAAEKPESGKLYDRRTGTYYMSLKLFAPVQTDLNPRPAVLLLMERASERASAVYGLPKGRARAGALMEEERRFVDDHKTAQESVAL